MLLYYVACSIFSISSSQEQIFPTKNISTAHHDLRSSWYHAHKFRFSVINMMYRPIRLPLYEAMGYLMVAVSISITVVLLIEFCQKRRALAKNEEIEGAARDV